LRASSPSIVAAEIMPRSATTQTLPMEKRQHIAFGKLVESAAQLDAVGLRASCRSPKDLLGSCGAQLLRLA
jgi:hypothetical protein